MTDKSSNENNHTNFDFGDSFNELERWPYAVHAIECTLDHKLISGRGKQLLFLGLNQRDVVAFAGSGLSQAFGRLGWKEWLDRQLRQVDDFANAFIDCSSASVELIDASIKLIDAAERDGIVDILEEFKEKLCEREMLSGEFCMRFKKNKMYMDGWKDIDKDDKEVLKEFLKLKKQEINYNGDEVKRLHSTFQNLKSEGGENYPVVFQVAEQLHEKLRLTEALYIDPSIWDDSESCKKSSPSEIYKQIFAATYFGFLIAPGLKLAPTDLLNKLDYIIAPFSINEDLHIQCYSNIVDAAVSELPGDESNDSNLTERVMRFTQKYFAFKVALHKYCIRAISPESRLSFSDLTKTLLGDECAHAEDIVIEATDYSLNSGRQEWSDYEAKEEGHLAANIKIRFDRQSAKKNNLSRDIKGIRKFPSRYDVLGFFKTCSFRHIAATLNEIIPLNLGYAGWTKVITQLVEELDKNNDENHGVKRKFVSPSHRFVFSMLLSLSEDPYWDFKGWLGSDGDDSEKEIFNKVSSKDFQSRLSIMDQELDPMEKLAGRLGIHRFLTTNYDFEIERYFIDRGYQLPDKPDPASNSNIADRPRVDGIGSTINDTSFSRHRATDLVAFSTNNGLNSASVFHLHGSATEDGQIVATERDYMNLYLRNDKYREVVDESIKITFSANTILFVGLGMDEDDVLRPLRQFMSDQNRANERKVIALFAADKNKAYRTKKAAALYIRYGVHTVFFGDGYVKYIPKDGGDTDLIQVDWLHYILKLVEELIDLNEEMLKATVLGVKFEEGQGNREEGEWKKIEEEWNKIKKNSDEGAIHPIRMASNRRLKLLNRKLGTHKFFSRGLEVERPVFSILCDTNKDLGKWKELEEVDEFAVCLFPAIQNWSKKSGDKNIAYNSVSSKPYLDFETRLLLNLLKMTVAGTPLTRKTNLTQKELQNSFVKACISDRKADIRDFKARIIGLKGLGTSIRTGTFCAAMDSLEKEWKGWWRRWEFSPPHRVANCQEKPPEFIKKWIAGEFRGGRWYSRREYEGIVYQRTPRRHVRHWIINTLVDLTSSECKDVLSKEIKIYETKVRSFDSFIEAVEHRVKFEYEAGSLGLGRRLYLVAAESGLGKGTFLSAFTTIGGLRNYMISAWPTPDHNEFWLPNKRIYFEKCTGSGFCRKYKVSPIYLHSIFMNLSFSSEVASIYDMLANILYRACAFAKVMSMSVQGMDRIAGSSYFIEGLRRYDQKQDQGKVYGFEKAEQSVRSETEELSRMLLLRTLLQIFSREASCVFDNVELADGSRPQFRLLVAISSIDQLQYSGGLAKNREIEEFLNLFIHDDSRHLPMDIILTTNEGNISNQFLHSSSFQDAYRNAAATTNYKASRRNLSNEEGEQPVGGRTLRRATDRSETRNLIFFPINRRDITYIGIQEVQKREHNSRIRFSATTRIDPDKHTPSCQIKDTSYLLAEDLKSPSGVSSNDTCYVHFIRRVSPTAVLISNFADLAAILFIGDLLRKLDQKVKDFAECAGVLRKYVAGYKGSPRDAVEPIIQKLKDLNRDEDVKGLLSVELKSIPTTGLNSDQALEVLSKRYKNDLDEQPIKEWHDIRRRLQGNRFCLTILLAVAEKKAKVTTDLIEGAKSAERFIRGVIDQVAASSQEKMEEVVISNVLDAYDDFHVIGQEATDIDLHLLIMRHLAVISAPCSADVLVKTPAIRKYLDGIQEYQNKPRFTLLKDALEALKERGLIFKLEPDSRNSTLNKKDGKFRNKYNDGRDPDSDFRYALHRLMQQHIVKKMGGGKKPLSELNNFATSLFVSMPSDLPRLTSESYDFLQILVAHLSQYPDRKNNDGRVESWHFGTACMTTRIQALRAALTAIRSTFSVSIVSRFEDYVDLEKNGTSKSRGHFETYRVQVRWIIRKAYELLDDDKKEDISYKPDKDNWPHINALYRDEIIWLYNECGVISLVQGNLRSAVSLLRRALMFNQKVEGGIDGGAQHNRISLNLSVVQIDRGNLSDAQILLNGICETEHLFNNERGRMWHLAYGYLGLIHHLTGNPKEAEKHFQDAITMLDVYDDARACAIFSYHFGNLKRAKGDYIEARKILNSALEFANSGGHEDVRRRIVLATVNLEIASFDNLSKNNIDDFSVSLSSIEEYAEAMEMPVLTCEVLRLKAKLIADTGDTSQAGSYLCNAIAIARRNDMNLRLNALLTDYAQVLTKRKLIDQAISLFSESLSMAKQYKYQPEIHRIQNSLSELGH